MESEVQLPLCRQRPNRLPCRRPVHDHIGNPDTLQNRVLCHGCPSDIHVEAGESPNLIKQIVKAAIYDGPAGSPPGITFLHLKEDLKFNSNVKPVLLPPYRSRNMDWHYKEAWVSGYRSTDKSTVLHTFFALTNDTCKDSSRLCALGYDWPLHDETSIDVARAKDFLEYYDPDYRKTFLIGVRKKHFTTNTASYYKVSDMMNWMNENLELYQYEH